jgi:hypothetical protein
MQRIPRTTDPAHLQFGSVWPAGGPDGEFDRVFEDFIESITLSAEELAVFVAMPEASVAEVKRMFAVPLRGEP